MTQIKVNARTALLLLAISSAIAFFFPKASIPFCIFIIIFCLVLWKRAGRWLALLVLISWAGIYWGILARSRMAEPALLPSCGISGGVLAATGRIAIPPQKSGLDSWLLGIDLISVRGGDGFAVSVKGRVSVRQRLGFTPVCGMLVELDGLEPPGDSLGGYGSYRVKNIRLLEDACRLERFRAGLRARMASRINRAGGKAGPLLEALLLGVKDNLDYEEAALFRDAGCSHILALSGQHVVVIALVIRLGLGFVLGRRHAEYLSCLVLIFYAWLCGSSPSVLRAVITFCLAVLTGRMDRPQAALSLLAWAWLILLGISPDGAGSVSAILSFLATLGIVLTSRRIDVFLKRWLPPLFSAPLAQGLAALWASSAYTVAVFGRINPSSPIVSALAGPLVTVLMLAGMFSTFLFSLAPFSLSICRKLCLWPWAILKSVITAGAAMPAIELDGGALRGCIIALAAIILYAWPYARRNFSAGRLQLPKSFIRTLKQHGLFDAETLRSEFPHQQGRKREAHKAAGCSKRLFHLGDRPRHRLHEL